jgi:hypothetical protein
MLRDIAEQTREHADLDNARFQEVHNVLANWHGIAMVVMIFVPAVVSLVVGIMIKYF